MKVPSLTPVKSSNLQSVGYSNAGLFVRFKGGSTYVYPEAPRSVFEDLVKAESPGTEFRHKIRDAYRHESADD